MKSVLVLAFLYCAFSIIFALPYNNLIVRPSLHGQQYINSAWKDIKKRNKEFDENEENSFEENKNVEIGLPPHPIIVGMDIKSKIHNRYAKTLVVSRTINYNNHSQDAAFSVILPNKAFISGFFMKTGKQGYTAFVMDKNEAGKQYKEATNNGESAGLVAVSARNSKKFIVYVNVEPQSEATFFLTYEELLERERNQYEHILNIYTGHFIKNLNVEVDINESSILKFVKIIPLRQDGDNHYPSRNLYTKSIDPTRAIIKYNPDCIDQKWIADQLNKKDVAATGQFVVQYDVERHNNGGQLLLQDGFFVHYFAPPTEKEAGSYGLKSIPKHAVFVLDKSGSMAGTKIEQLKDAMQSILDEMEEQDVVDIVEFSSNMEILDINTKSRILVEIDDYENPFKDLETYDLPTPSYATRENIETMQSLCSEMLANGGTNGIGGIEAGLYLIKQFQAKNVQNNKLYQPLLVFLTDGEPNEGVTSKDDIVKIVTQLNSLYNNVPIFSLSFGDDADKEFLKKLSLENKGFSRHIYEAADASLQLQEFFKEISSPLLKNVNFQYENVNEVTKTTHPVYFKGTELVAAGRYDKANRESLHFAVQATGSDGLQSLEPSIETPVGSLEKIWVYLTVQQKLEEAEISANREQLLKEALDLALKYSFVTDLTSLVIRTPSGINSFVNLEKADSGLEWSDSSSSKYVWSSCEDDQWIISPVSRTCYNSPLNETDGLCVPIDSCPEIYDYLEKSNILGIPPQYFCLLDDRTEGVCCPTAFPPPSN